MGLEGKIMSKVNGWGGRTAATKLISIFSINQIQAHCLLIVVRWIFVSAGLGILNRPLALP